jgi:hypothetical protein
MKRYVWLWVLLFGATGCALSVHTQGVVGPVAWSTTALDLDTGSGRGGDPDRFSFTLALRETQGLALTLTTMTWQVWQNGVEISGRQTRTGSWSLPAHGTLLQPVVYRIVCPTSTYCPNVGPTTQWEITFEGHDAQGQAVHLVVQAELPWIPPKADSAPPDLQREPSVVLPPIEFTVRRLYYPLYGND